MSARMYNPRTEQYLVVGDPVAVPHPTGNAALGTIDGFTRPTQGQCLVAVVIEDGVAAFPIEDVVLHGTSKLVLGDLAILPTTRLIYTLIDLHESRYFRDFRAATKDERAAYVEAIEKEINHRIPPTKRLP